MNASKITPLLDGMEIDKTKVPHGSLILFMFQQVFS